MNTKTPAKTIVTLLTLILSLSTFAQEGFPHPIYDWDIRPMEAGHPESAQPPSFRRPPFLNNPYNNPYRRQMIEQAKIDYEKACDQGKGDTEGCLQRGLIAEREDRNTSEAKDFYRMACEHNNMDGCNQQARLEFRDGEVFIAKKLLEKACQKNHKPSCENIKITNKSIF